MRAEELPVEVPQAEGPCVAWRAVRGSASSAGQTPFWVETPHGVALVEPGEARLELKRRVVQLEVGPSRRVMAAGKGTAAQAKAADEDAKVKLSWLEEGGEVCVVGTPAWESVPDAAGGYRSSALVPVFRGQEVLVADRSEQELRRERLWELWAWAVWTVAAGLLLGIQLLGRLPEVRWH
jgi:hypothetical protein